MYDWFAKSNPISQLGGNLHRDLAGAAIQQFGLRVLGLWGAVLSPEDMQQRHLAWLRRSHMPDSAGHVGKVPAPKCRPGVVFDPPLKRVTVELPFLVTSARVSVRD